MKGRMFNGNISIYTPSKFLSLKATVAPIHVNSVLNIYQTFSNQIFNGRGVGYDTVEDLLLFKIKKK